MAVEELVRPGFKMRRTDNERLIRLADEHGYAPWRVEAMALDLLEERIVVGAPSAGGADDGCSRPLSAAPAPGPLGEVRPGEVPVRAERLSGCSPEPEMPEVRGVDTRTAGDGLGSGGLFVGHHPTRAAYAGSGL